MGRTSSSWVWFKLVAFGWWEGVREKQNSLSLPALLPAQCLEPFDAFLQAFQSSGKGFCLPHPHLLLPAQHKALTAGKLLLGNTSRNCWRGRDTVLDGEGVTRSHFSVPSLWSSCAACSAILAFFIHKCNKNSRKKMEARLLSHYFSTDGLKMGPYSLKRLLLSLHPVPRSSLEVCLGCPHPAEQWEQGQGQALHVRIRTQGSALWDFRHHPLPMAASPSLHTDHTNPDGGSWPRVRARRHFLVLEPLELDLWTDRRGSSSELAMPFLPPCSHPQPQPRAGVAKTTSQSSQV